jgi:hypothetical protein
VFSAILGCVRGLRRRVEYATGPKLRPGSLPQARVLAVGIYLLEDEDYKSQSVKCELALLSHREVVSLLSLIALSVSTPI